MNHIVCAKFEPGFVNPMTARRGQWRVTASYSQPFDVEKVLGHKSRQELVMVSTKTYPRGSIIRPHAELRRVLEARKAMQ